jgi:hypothetical protein
MAKKFLTNLDLAKNQILNVALQNLASAPSSPVAGQIYFNTSDAVVYFYDGTAWVDVSGDIRDVVGGSGLSASTSNRVVTLDINVDNATIEINSDSLRVKDLGITTGKLADSAVTTIKINNNAVTLSKIQQIAAMKLLANVTGAPANVQEVDIITDLSTGATDANLATSLAIKTYVDGVVATLGNLEGGWDASSGSFPVGDEPTLGTKKGDYWYVTVAGTVGGVGFNVGDVIVAKVDNASTSLASDWIQLEVNRDQATETALGLLKIATQTETNDGINDTSAVTPAKLAGRTATETRTGIAELATQAEVDAGTDDARIVTPLKLKTMLDNRTGGYAVNVGDGVATSYALSHGLNTRDVVVSIYDNTTYEEVLTDVVLTSTSVVTVSFATAPATDAYRVVIKK